ncbi:MULTISPECIES: hypothetical protein [Streptomyces]|uniref:hypothetical protein n=1 Tax=Streptomyces TaxID=1883 RepID=UPI00345B6071
MPENVGASSPQDSVRLANSINEGLQKVRQHLEDAPTEGGGPAWDKAEAEKGLAAVLADADQLSQTLAGVNAWFGQRRP